jgi:hypothetical protein
MNHIQEDLLLFQFHRRQVAASTFLGALTSVGALLGQSFFEHLPAQGRSALALLLSVAQQLAQLLFLFLVKLVGLGAKEFPFQIGNDRLGLGQLLRLEHELLLGLCLFLLRLRQLLLQLHGIPGQPGRIIGKLAQEFFGGLHPWSASRKPRHNG